jgi:ribosome-associated translation inhibitor RaiA
MRIGIGGIARDAALRARVTERVGATLATLKVKPVAAGVTFFDDNGPKGGVAMRCALTVRVPYRPTLRVEKTAQTRRVAFDEAVKALDRQLERYRERDRDSRRHPKKYFVAKRLIASVSALPTSAAGK